MSISLIFFLVDLVLAFGCQGGFCCRGNFLCQFLLKMASNCEEPGPGNFAFDSDSKDELVERYMQDYVENDENYVEIMLRMMKILRTVFLLLHYNGGLPLSLL